MLEVLPYAKNENKRPTDSEGRQKQKQKNFPHLQNMVSMHELLLCLQETFLDRRINSSKVKRQRCKNCVSINQQ